MKTLTTVTHIVAMLTLRCTAKTLKRFDLRAVADPPESSGRLGDWYANLLNVGARRHVLCVSEKTLLPVIMPARKQEFPALFTDHLYQMLRALDIPDHLATTEAGEANDVTIARTASRSVLGVMNEMTASMAYYVVPDDLKVSALRMSMTRYSPLGYAKPAAVTRHLFGLEGQGPAHVAVLASGDLILAGKSEDPTSRLTRTRPAFRLKLTLEETKPAIWREVWVEDGTTLSDLHRIFQVVMGWFDYHLYEFEVGGTRYEDPDPEAEGEDATKVTLAGLSLGAGDIFRYTYDFGDDWRCEVRVQESRELSAHAWLPYLIAGERAGPPEDAGGVGGLADLIEALRDPAHPEHRSYRTWAGEHYDPDRLDIRAINGFLGLAAGWGAIGPPG